MADIFISYARSTALQAQAIAEALRALGYGVWRDDELPAHRSYAEVIEERLKAAKAVVVIWSAEAARSEWVQSEADRARNDRKLVQITVDGAPLPMPFDRIQCADLSGWAGDVAAPGWRKVVASIADLAGGSMESARRNVEQARRTELSICVLPFANMSNDADQEYFADGISEDIITDLSKVSALGVISRNSAFTFKGKHVDLPEVARQLRVSHVLEGSVRKFGNRVRITAQLIDGATNNHVWAERYDRDLNDIFALQDEISEAIVAALKLKLLPEEKRAIEKRGTTNAEAYDLFLRARALGNQWADGLRVHDLLRQAIALDAKFWHAQYALATTLEIAARFMPDRNADLLKEVDAVRANLLAAAPGEYYSLILRARELMGRRRYLEAEHLLDEAEPHATEAAAGDFSIIRGEFFACVWRFNDALAIIRQAVRNDPLSFDRSVHLAVFLESTGHIAEAEAELERGRDLSTPARDASELLALQMMWKRASPDEIKVQWARMAEANRRGLGVRFPFLDQIEPVIFDPEAARGILRSAFEDPAYQDPRQILTISSFAALFDDKDLALTALRRAAVAMGPAVMSRLHFAEVRKDPRFKDIVRDLGLYAYWRKSGRWSEFARPLGDDDFEIVR